MIYPYQFDRVPLQLDKGVDVYKISDEDGVSKQQISQHGQASEEVGEEEKGTNDR